MSELLHKKFSYAITGSGFLEAVYPSALAHELGLRGMHFMQQTPLEVRCKNAVAGEFQIDFLADHKVIILRPADKMRPHADRGRFLSNHLRSSFRTAS